MPAATTTAPGSRLDRRTLLVGLVVVLGTAMSNLDATVVNVALDRLAEAFAAPLEQVQWAVTGYTLALATTIPLSAWAIGRVGARGVYLLSVAAFTAASALTAGAWSAGSLIAFRLLQGLAGGMLMPTGATIMAREAGERSARVMSVVGVPMLLLPMAGPVLGGWLVDAASWRWIFVLNVPVGALALLLAGRTLARVAPAPERAQRLDVGGLLLLSPALATLTYGLARAAAPGGALAPGALVPAAAGVVLGAGFVVHARVAAHPLLDLRLLGRRAVAAAASALALFSGALLGSMLLVPLYLQLPREESALHAGMLVAPQGVGAALSMPLGGRLVDRRGPRPALLTGLVISAAGLLALTTQLGAGTPLARLVAAQLLMGAGMGMTMMPAMAAALWAVPRAEVAATSTVLTIVQRVASSAGTALATVLLASALSARLGLPAGHRPVPATAATAAPMAAAFRQTSGLAAVPLLAALIPAVLLPRRGRGRP